ncbi:hypothetical protein [Nocardia sp. NBC_00511]|uniref:hypothetical protein n=1 Tax=Nocardia sp. NBC_00511 TaxID=2903591 RepID=UPI0030DF1B25
MSLVIDPAAIASIQTVELPIPTLTPSSDPTHVQIMCGYDRAENEVQAAAAIDIDDAFRQLLGEHYDTLARPTSKPAKYQPSPDSIALLEQAFLAGVGQPVRDDFSHALQRWHPTEDSDAEAFYKHFRALSVLLTQPESVAEAMRVQPVRAGESIKVVRDRQSMRDSRA